MWLLLYAGRWHFARALALIVAPLGTRPALLEVSTLFFVNSITQAPLLMVSAPNDHANSSLATLVGDCSQAKWFAYGDQNRWVSTCIQVTCLAQLEPWLLFPGIPSLQPGRIRQHIRLLSPITGILATEMSLHQSIITAYHVHLMLAVLKLLLLVLVYCEPGPLIIKFELVFLHLPPSFAICINSAVRNGRYC